MKRYALIIGLRPEKYEEYKSLHAAVWPGVLAKIADCGIRNYSIYHHDGLLFAYYEYHGDDHEADMAKMAADPETQAWWKICDPCQKPVEGCRPGQWWASMEEMFHTD